MWGGGPDEFLIKINTQKFLIHGSIFFHFFFNFSSFSFIVPMDFSPNMDNSLNGDVINEGGASFQSVSCPRVMTSSTSLPPFLSFCFIFALFFFIILSFSFIFSLLLWFFLDFSLIFLQMKGWGPKWCVRELGIFRSPKKWPYDVISENFMSLPTYFISFLFALILAHQNKEMTV